MSGSRLPPAGASASHSAPGPSTNRVFHVGFEVTSCGLAGLRNGIASWFQAGRAEYW